MAFTVHVAEPVEQYIRSRERLTVSDQDRIFAGLEQELGEHADQFLERNPHPFLPDRFWYDFLLMTDANEVRGFHFACSAEGHVYGVIEVLYAEEQPTDTR
jgi:hypothetical protein